MAWRSEEWRTVLFWLPVVGVAALSQTAVGTEIAWQGGTGSLALISLLLCLPLLLRITRPMLATIALGAVLIAQMELGGTLHFGSFVALLVTTYCLGRHGTNRDVLVGLPVLFVAVVVSMRGSLPEDAAELIFPAFYITATVGVGRVIRQLSTQAADLRRLNETLNRERDLAAQLAIATERMRIARDLHDAVAHSLTATAIQAQDCEDAVDSDPERARQASRRIQEVARAGLEDLRRTVRMLREDEDQGPGPGVREIPALATVMAGAGLKADVRIDGTTDGLAPEQDHTLFRIAQEALTNVMKHSASDTATVQVEVDDQAASLTITDPGPAVEAALPSGGRGIAGMTERVAQLDGTLEARPDDDGFLVRARLPLADPS